MSVNRDVDVETQGRVLLRTANVYQTEDDVTKYSETLLAVVASFANDGEPEGFNAQCMVGKSKRGEVACQLFARINPETYVIEEARFKARGCLAIIACASMVCTMLEGRTIDEALLITTDEVYEALDGVPAGRILALDFAVEACKALVGDFMLREGATLSELDQKVVCDPQSLACVFCEHCSLRDARIDKEVEEIKQAQALAEHNAIAQAFDQVRKDSADSLLSHVGRWVELGILPEHMTELDLEMSVYDYLKGWQKDHPELTNPAPTSPSGLGASGSAAAAHAAAGASPYACRPVGISPFAREATGKDPDGSDGVYPGMGEGSSVNKAADADEAPIAGVASEGTADEANANKEAAAQGEMSEEEDPLSRLNVPDGYQLQQIEGEWTLVQADPSQTEKELEINPTGIQILEGESGYYLYDSSLMSGAYAHWAFLAAEDDPLVTFADCVREESQTYPRPLALSSLGNPPFAMSEQSVEETWNRARQRDEYSDIKRISASNGKVFFYSTKFLSPDRAQAIAEWDAVERMLNV